MSAARAPGGTSSIATQGVRAFRHRNYRLFFAGQLTSLVGTWMQQVAQGWLVLQLTHDPFWLGLVATAQFLPVVVLGLFGGVLADQLPKRGTLIVSQAAAMILALVLFVLTATGTVEVWHVLVLAALLGVTNAIEMPTRQAFTVEMVGREDVGNAIGWNSSTFNGARVVGPAIAGLTIAAFDISVAFLINAVSFMAVIAAYLAMREGELRPAPRLDRPHSVGDVVDSLVEGLAYVRRTDIVLLAVLTVGLVATFGMNFGVVIPPLASDVLRSDASGFGFLMAATGIGSLAAALAVAFGSRIRTMAIPLGAIALGVGSVVAGVSNDFWLTFLALTVVGGGGIAMAVTANAAIQTAVPDQLRGRVLSVYTTIFSLSVPLGGLLTGWLASAFGVQVALVVGGVLSALVGIGALVRLRRLGRHGLVIRPSPEPSADAATALTTARPR